MEIDRQTYDDVVELIKSCGGQGCNETASLILGRLGIAVPQEKPKQRIATNWRIENESGSTCWDLVGDYHGKRIVIGTINRHTRYTFYTDHVKLILAAPDLAELLHDILVWKDVIKQSDRKTYRILQYGKLLDMAKKKLIEIGYLDETT